MAAKLEIATGDGSDPVSLSCIDCDLPIFGVIAQRSHAADPQPFTFGCRDLVADALGPDFTLELGKGQ